MPCILASLLLSLSAATGRQGDGEKAIALLDEVAASMSDASAVTFESEVAIATGPITVAQKAKVLLQRPDHARLELAGAGQDALLVFDGATSWHYLKAKRGFVKAKQRGTAKLEQYGAGPVATLFFRKEAGPLVPYLEDAVVTREKLGEAECDVVTWTVGPEETRLWIEGKRLRKFRTTRSIAGNQFEQSFTYGPVDLAPHVADDAFVFLPPKGARVLEEGGDDELLAVGAAAPAFALTKVDGSALRSADLAGKPLLLTFWFYGCATCREEFPRLQELHAALEKRGVVLLAIDYGDSRETVATYFEKERFTFTPALQEKGEVSSAFGVAVYPTNVLVGPDGRIAWRAAGFDEAALKAALDLLPGS